MASLLPPEYDPPIAAEHWREWGLRLRRGGGRPTVVVHGGYGKRNLGDDAILEVLLAQLGEALPGARVVVLCHGPEEVMARHPVEAHHFASRGALRAIWAADLYIIGGGGIVNRINTYSGRRRWRVLDPKGKFLFLATLLAGARGARVIYHIIGATSVPDPLAGWLARVAMNRADEVTVRDPLSREVLSRLGVQRELRVLPDPALSLAAAPPEVAWEILRREGIDPDEPWVGINLRPVVEPDIDNAETAATMGRLAEELAETRGAQLVFLPFGLHPRIPAENDLTMVEPLRAALRHPERLRVLRHPCTPPEMKALLAQMDLGILERLHAAILAASAGAPFVALDYDDKVAQFVRAIGGEARLIPLRGLREDQARATLAAAEKDSPPQRRGERRENTMEERQEGLPPASSSSAPSAPPR